MDDKTLREAVARAIDACDPDRIDHALCLRQADAAIATMFERLRTPIWDALAAAYTTGATDVHNSWIAGTNGGEPDFGEAASDYAACVDPLTAFQQENSDAATDR